MKQGALMLNKQFTGQQKRKGLGGRNQKDMAWTEQVNKGNAQAHRAKPKQNSRDVKNDVLQLPSGNSPFKQAADQNDKMQEDRQLLNQKKPSRSLMEKRKTQRIKDKKMKEKEQKKQEYYKKLANPVQSDNIRGQFSASDGYNIRKKEMEKQRELDMNKNQKSLTPHLNKKVQEHIDATKAIAEEQVQQVEAMRQLTETNAVASKLKNGLLNKFPIFEKIKNRLKRLQMKPQNKLRKDKTDVNVSYVSSCASCESARRHAEKTKQKYEEMMQKKPSDVEIQKSKSEKSFISNQFVDFDIMHKAQPQKKVKQQVKQEHTIYDRFNSCFKD